MHLPRPAAVLALTAGLVIGGGALPAQADGDGGRSGDNVVLALADAERPVVERSKVEVVVARGDVVDNGNVARAVSQDCTGCRAVAVAFQAVLIPGTPTTVVPENGAAAFNVACTGCTTAAFAYQYVVRTDGATELSDAGEDAVAQVRRQVRDVTRSGLTPAEIDARLDVLEAQFRAAVDAGIAGEHDGEDDEDSDEDD